MTLIAAILADGESVKKSELRAYLAARETINVKDSAFGAVGDGKSDDTAAIQKAIDYAIYGNAGDYNRSVHTESHPAVVFFPQGRYRITDTLHVGYGTTFTHCSLIGEMDQVFPGIIATFNDRPAIAVQGVRSVRITGLHVSGVNLPWLQIYGENVKNRAERSAWAGPNLAPGGLSRYAPYAGIAIDPYSGPQPPGGYPAVRYPGFLGSVAQYNKNFSSRVMIDKCHISGFAVGVVIQPGQADGNGDYVSISNSELPHNIIAFACGNAQARCSNFVNNVAAQCHTVFDTLTFGQQRGNISGEISGCEFSYCYQIFNISLSFSHAAAVSSCYAEALYRLGKISAGASSVHPIKFEACHFEFHQHHNQFEWTPPALLDCSPSQLVEFDTCMLGTGPVGSMVVIGAARARLTNCMVRNGEIFDVATIAGKIAKSASLGVWDDYSPLKRRMHVGAVRPGDTYDFSGRVPPGLHAQTVDCEFVDVEEHGDRPLPLWTRRLGCSGSGVDYEASCYAYSQGIRGLARAGREYTCVLAPNVPVGPGQIPKGAIVVAAANLYYVKSAAFEQSAVRVVLVQLTNVRKDKSSWSVKPGAELADTPLYFWNSAKFYPTNVPVYLEAAAGSDTAILKLLGTGAPHPPALGAVTVGDLYDGGPRYQGLASSSLAASTFQSAAVSALTPPKAAIRLSSPARLTMAVPYPVFVKTSY